MPADRYFFNYNGALLDVMPIRIGANVSFGPGVQLYTASHPLDAAKRAKGAEFAKPIAIGEGCWPGGETNFAGGDDRRAPRHRGGIGCRQGNSVRFHRGRKSGRAGFEARA